MQNIQTEKTTEMMAHLQKLLIVDFKFILRTSGCLLRSSSFEIPVYYCHFLSEQSRLFGSHSSSH